MFINKIISGLLGCLLAIYLLSCNTSKPVATGGPDKTGGQKLPAKTNKYEPMDTVRWTTPTNAKPPIQNDGTRPQNNGQAGNHNHDTYRIALLLPFLSGQFDETTVPEKSRLALQFYAGAKIALERQSREKGANIILDVYDAPLNDAEFQTLLSDRNLAKAQILIGPVRSTQVQAAAVWAKQNRKILVSPESPNSDLTTGNPDFLQINPSLRAHCEGIAQFVQEHYASASVTLLCKTKESDRLPYFQDYRKSRNLTPFTEWVVPDETVNFEKFDLKPYLKPGKTAVFILPTWANQDFVMAFFRKLKAVKGNTPVAVLGMPQWKNYESIEPEFLAALNVHISSAEYFDYNNAEVADFQQTFFESTGTIPDDDGFNGYDLTRFVCNMLNQYGLSFPDKLGGNVIKTLHAPLIFSKVRTGGALDDRSNTFDYWENKYVHILKFDRFGFVPVERD